MSKRETLNLSGIDDAVRERLSFEAPKNALARWKPALRAAAADEDEYVINLYDIIARDEWGGFSAKKMSALLRAAGDRRVRLNINSPGGDVFEGIAMYNLLRDHPQDVNVRVVGLAASAASIVMAGGDNIQIGRASFVMVHNVWAIVIGNRNDMRKFADTLESIDDALASVYSALTGKDKKRMSKLMDDETWFNGEQSVAEGFAHSLLPADAVTEGEREDGDKGPEALVRRVNLSLMKAGIRREERSEMVEQLRAALSGAPITDSPSRKEAPMPTEAEVKAKAEAEAKEKSEREAREKAEAEAEAKTASGGATQDQIAAAIKADRERISAIMALPEAKGREKLAQHLANSGASVEDAKATLEASPKATSMSEVMDKIGGAGVDQTDIEAHTKKQPRLMSYAETYAFLDQQMKGGAKKAAH